jgi:hypothetical protein
MQNFIMCLAIITGAGLLGLSQRDRRFSVMMVVYGSALAAACVIGVVNSLSSGDPLAPYLADSDGNTYFQEARLLAARGAGNFRELIITNYAGYQLLLSVVFMIFGPSLAAGVALNALIFLLAITLLFRATFLLTGSPNAARSSVLLMMLTTVNIFYILMLLKEPALGLSFALLLLAVTKAATQKGLGFWPFVYLAFALLIIMSMRTSLLLFLLVLAGFVGPIIARRRSHAVVAFVGAMILVAPFAQSFTTYELDASFFTSTIVQNQVISTRFEDGDLSLTGVAGRIIGFYIDQPFYLKAVLIPIPVGVQILLPFDFWSTRFIEEHFASFFARNLNPLWYLYVFVWILFALTRPRQIPSILIRRFLYAGAIYYVVVAFIYGGLIPRYGTPALFFLLPAAGYWWNEATENRAVRSRARSFFLSYYAVAGLAGAAFVLFQVMRG